jgi:hypothetical protein
MINSNMVRFTAHVSQMREKRNAYCLLTGKPEGKRPIRRIRRMRLNNVKMDG